MWLPELTPVKAKAPLTSIVEGAFVSYADFALTQDERFMHIEECRHVFANRGFALPQIEIFNAFLLAAPDVF